VIGQEKHIVNGVGHQSALSVLCKKFRNDFCLAIVQGSIELVAAFVAVALAGLLPWGVGHRQRVAASGVADHAAEVDVFLQRVVDCVQQLVAWELPALVWPIGAL